MPIAKDLFPANGFTFPYRHAAWQAKGFVQPFSAIEFISEESFGNIPNGTTFELLNGQFVSTLTYCRFLNSPLLGN
jgi:hypothetical protein